MSLQTDLDATDQPSFATFGAIISRTSTCRRSSDIFGVVASIKALSRRQKDRKLMRHLELRELVIERIKDGWTPEQIAGRLIYENAPVRVCQETIYRFVYSAEGMKENLWWYLPEHRRKGRAPKKPKKSTLT
jgi:IS30 family transposase